MHHRRIRSLLFSFITPRYPETAVSLTIPIATIRNAYAQLATSDGTAAASLHRPSLSICHKSRSSRSRGSGKAHGSRSEDSVLTPPPLTPIIFRETVLCCDCAQGFRLRRAFLFFPFWLFPLVSPNARNKALAVGCPSLGPVANP